MLFILSDPGIFDNMILHIDDGSMGGGGPIPHKEYLYKNHQDDKPDFDEYRDKYFDVNTRGDIFHYCIFCHHGKRDDGTTDFDGCTQGSGDFQINDENMGEGFWHSKESDQAQTFMHELGHYIIDDDADHLNSNGHCDNKAEGHEGDWFGGWCAMRSSADFDGASFCPNYCIKCWNSLDLQDSIW